VLKNQAGGKMLTHMALELPKQRYICG